MIKKLMKIYTRFFFYIQKMTNKYYQKHIERLGKEARKRYQNLAEEEKEKKGGSKNPSEKQKQKLVEFMENYYLAHKK